MLNSSVFDNVSASFLAANAAPTLAPIANQTVNVGQTVAFTAIATATNSPQPTLNFSLLNAPINATLAQINNTNANFNWRPWVTNANSTNAVALMVALSGFPSLSATQSFTIVVNPLILPSVSSVMINNGQLRFQISGRTGPRLCRAGVLEPLYLEHTFHHQFATHALLVDGHQCGNTAGGVLSHQDRAAAAIGMFFQTDFRVVLYDSTHLH